MQIVWKLVNAACLLLCGARGSSASVIYESSALGQVGITHDQVNSQAVLASNIATFNFVGVRFHVAQDSIATAIGGHFVGGFASNSFFGAIARLDDGVDFPDSGDFSTPDVLGIANLTFPDPSAEVVGSLSASLKPGWYAAIFGTGLFGATGRGGAVRNGQDLASPSYIVWQPDNGWFEHPSQSGNFHFVVEGTIVPEPAAAAIALLGTLLTAATCRRTMR
jgi:hypothetical protein